MAASTKEQNVFRQSMQMASSAERNAIQALRASGGQGPNLDPLVQHVAQSEQALAAAAAAVKRPTSYYQSEERNSKVVMAALSGMAGGDSSSKSTPSSSKSDKGPMQDHHPRGKSRTKRSSKA